MDLSRPGVKSALIGFGLGLVGRVLNVVGETDRSPAIGLIALAINVVALALLVGGFGRMTVDEFRARTAPDDDGSTEISDTTIEKMKMDQ